MDIPVDPTIVHTPMDPPNVDTPAVEAESWNPGTPPESKDTQNTQDTGSQESEATLTPSENITQTGNEEDMEADTARTNSDDYLMSRMTTKLRVNGP